MPSKRIQALLANTLRLLWSLRRSFGGLASPALAPGVIALAFAPFLVPLLRVEVKEPLFGDTLVFQYTGWCIRHGLRLYRDVGMPDGPFIHYLHAAIQGFAGITDRGFRKCDLALEASGGAAIGALLAPTAKMPRAGRIASRIAWAAMAATVWLAWYLDLSWTETTERETFYSLFGSVGMVVVYVSDGWTRRWARPGVFLGALLVTTQAFGKPTGVVYPALAFLGVLLPSATSAMSRSLRVRLFVAGGAACVLLVLFAFLVSGSLKGYFLWCWRIPYIGNRYLWGVDWLRLLLRGAEALRTMAIVSFLAGTAAIASGLLPPRSLGFALAPSLLFLGACLQARGYPYQFVPVTASFHAILLVALSALWEQSGDREWPKSRRFAPALALCFLGYHALQNLQTSPYVWDGDRTKWDTPVNHFADDEKKVGEYLREHTKPTDRVFAYSAGENASVVLLYGQRRTASPFFHSFWLDPVDLVQQSEIKPDAEHLAALERLQKEIQGIACSTVEQGKPAAMTFNLLEQVFKVCPKIEEMLRNDYDDATAIGTFHVYKRKPAGAPREEAQSRK
jgi:hypothetical protein